MNTNILIIISLNLLLRLKLVIYSCRRMLSKNKAKLIIALQKKKVREESGLFVIEGDKLIREFLEAGYDFRYLVAREEFISGLSSLYLSRAGEITAVSDEELRKVSTLSTPHNALAVLPVFNGELKAGAAGNSLVAALDFIQDPGNLGTIIRAAAWFGIAGIVCSENCVDLYNPKVIQASMGAVMHVPVHYTRLSSFLGEARRKNIPVYGTLLEGRSIYEHRLGANGIILLGNESKGISQEIKPFISEIISIPGPRFSLPGIESLNVSMASAVVFSEFRRRKSGPTDRTP